MGSTGCTGEDRRIEYYPVVVSHPGGHVALGYTTDEAPSHHILQIELPVASPWPTTTTPYGGYSDPATRRPGTYPESGTDLEPGIRWSRIRKFIKLACQWFVLVGLFLLLVAVFVGGLVYLMINSRPSDPTFLVRDFAVSNFSISGRGAGLSATWEANLTLVNPNDDINYRLKYIRSFVYYHHNPRSRLSLSLQQHLDLHKNSTSSMISRSYTTGSDILEASVVKKIRKELRATGSLSFGLGIHLREESDRLDKFYPGDYNVITLYCKGLKVAFGFSGDVGFGNLSLPTDTGSSEIKCKAYDCPYMKPAAETLYC